MTPHRLIIVNCLLIAKPGKGVADKRLITNKAHYFDFYDRFEINESIEFSVEAAVDEKHSIKSNSSRPKERQWSGACYPIRSASSLICISSLSNPAEYLLLSPDNELITICQDFAS